MSCSEGRCNEYRKNKNSLDKRDLINFIQNNFVDIISEAKDNNEMISKVNKYCGQSEFFDTCADSRNKKGVSLGEMGI